MCQIDCCPTFIPASLPSPFLTFSLSLQIFLLVLRAKSVMPWRNGLRGMSGGGSEEEEEEEEEEDGGVEVARGFAGGDSVS